MKEFLDKEFAKYKTWEDCKKSNKFINLFEGHKDKKTGKSINPKAMFGQATGKQGVGQTTILKFLGSNWKQHMIQEALSLKEQDEEGTVDRKAVEEFDTGYQAKEFRKAVKSYQV